MSSQPSDLGLNPSPIPKAHSKEGVQRVMWSVNCTECLGLWPKPNPKHKQNRKPTPTRAEQKTQRSDAKNASSHKLIISTSWSSWKRLNHNRTKSSLITEAKGAKKWLFTSHFDDRLMDLRLLYNASTHRFIHPLSYDWERRSCNAEQTAYSCVIHGFFCISFHRSCLRSTSITDSHSNCKCSNTISEIGFGSKFDHHHQNPIQFDFHITFNELVFARVIEKKHGCIVEVHR